MSTTWFAPNRITTDDEALVLQFPSGDWPADGPGRNRALEITSRDPGDVQWLSLQIEATNISAVRICYATPDTDPVIEELSLVTGPSGGVQGAAGFPLALQSARPTCKVHKFTLENPRFLSGVVGRCEAELRRDVLARAFPIEAFVLSRLSQAMHIESFGPSGEGEDGGGESILRARSCCG